jgi:predicted SPOUT superfamily RNA methylase MTH1
MNSSNSKRGNGGRGSGGSSNQNSKRRRPNKSHDNHGHNNHRFGGVMSQPPKFKLQPTTMTSTSSTTTTYPTVSIAIPGSVVSNAQTRELQTQLAGQIARAAAVYRVDEIVVFDDGLGSSLKTVSNYRRGPSQHRKRDEEEDDKSNNNDSEKQQPLKEKKEQPPHMQPSTDPHAFLARILQYCECPQYLRRKFFPMHPDLQFAGLLPPLDAPHHLRRGDFAAFREGVVVERKSGDGGKGGDEDGGSFVDCGVPNRLVQ